MNIESQKTRQMIPHAEDFEPLRESVEAVLEAECGSLAIHAFIDGETALDRTLWSRAAELGWLGAALPEEWGGLGLGARGLQVLHKELGRRAAPGPFIATLSVAQWLSDVGSVEQKSRFLSGIADGSLTAALPAQFATNSPMRVEAGRLCGSMNVLGSPDAQLVALPAVLPDGAIAWVLLVPDGSAASLVKRDIWDRTRQICSLECTDAEIAGLMPDPDGEIGRRLLRYVSLAIAADCVGGAEDIAHQTVEYLKTRVQFDRPVASFQAIKHRAADLVARTETQRFALDQATESLEQESPDATMWVALAKVGTSEAFAFVSGDCIQLHGGVGHTWEYNPHIYAKRARLNEALASDNRTMLDLAAGALADATAQGRLTTEIHL